MTTAGGPPIVTCRGLSMVYGDNVVLDGVDLEIPRGQVVTLLGPNGAGKTTTVEILEGFRRRSSGTVLLRRMARRQSGTVVAAARERVLNRGY